MLLITLMKNHAKRSLQAASVVLLALITLFAGCAPRVYHTGTYVPPRVRYSSPYYYDYHYYPSVKVYFNLYSGWYYYRSGPGWVHARTLPSRFYLSPRDRVHLRIWADVPYRHFATHQERFRPYPSYRHNRDYNRFERRYNRSHHEQYLRRYRR